MGKTSAVAFLAAWVLTSMLPYSVGVARAATITLPCAQAQASQGESGNYLAPCTTSQDTTDLSACTPIPDPQNPGQKILPPRFNQMGIVAQVRCLVKRETLIQAEAFYRGIAYNAQESNASGRISGTPVQTPVCSHTGNSFSSGQPEQTDNHLARGTLPAAIADLPGMPASAEPSCGQLARVTGVSLHGLSVNNSGPNGTREHAVRRGLFPQAIDCTESGVQQEISRRRVTIGSACEGLAQDINAGGTSFSSESEAWGQYLRGQAGMESSIRGDPCDASSTQQWNAGSDNLSDAEYSRQAVRQRAMRLCASRVSYVSLFSKLMMCEINARASAELRTLPTAVEMQDEIEQLSTSIPQCQSCRSYRRRIIAASSSVVGAGAVPRLKRRLQGCLNDSCYPALTDRYFRQIYERFNKQSAPACQPRAQTETEKREVVYASAARILIALLMFALSSLFGGCSDNSTDTACAVDPTRTQSSYPSGTCPCQYDPKSECCKADGTGVDNLADLIADGTCNDLSDFADDAMRAQLEGGLEVLDRETQNRIVLGGYSSRSDHTLPQGSGISNGAQGRAAADGGTVTSFSPRPKAEDDVSPILARALPKGDPGSNTNSTGSGGAAGGMPSGVSTPPGSGSSGDPDAKQAQVFAESAGGGARAGRGGGDAGGGFGGFSLPSMAGGNAGAAGGSGVTTLGFGSPGSGPTTTDPSDYFARTTVNDSIFRIVHDRYQKASRREGL